jgi:AraC family transcriptional regulator
MRTLYLYLDPDNPLICDEESGRAACAPRLFFEGPALWQTALKLKVLIEAGLSASQLYTEALAIVLLHELLDSRRVSVPRARGGLAHGPRRAALQYIEEHLAQEISLSTLASVAQLSPYHFCALSRNHSASRRTVTMLGNGSSERKRYSPTTISPY